jgi:hypothetical protein
MCPATSTAREIGASFSKDKWVRDNSCTTAVCGGGVARPTQQRGQGIPVGSNRSAFQHVRFATGSAATSVRRECFSKAMIGKLSLIVHLSLIQPSGGPSGRRNFAASPPRLQARSCRRCGKRDHLPLPGIRRGSAVRRARKDLLQKLLAMHIGYVAQFVAIEMQQIESVIVQPAGAFLRRARAGARGNRECPPRRRPPPPRRGRPAAL